MSSPEKSSESITYLPGASANGSELIQAEAVDPPIVPAPPDLSEPAAVEAQARLEALERQLAEIMYGTAHEPVDLHSGRHVAVYRSWGRRPRRVRAAVLGGPRLNSPADARAAGALRA